MIERIEYWRGFTGGFIAGVAVGVWIYFSQRTGRQIIDFDGFDRGTPEELSQRQKPMVDANRSSTGSSLTESKSTGS